tara:strand:+ start:262 stop:366 length:105 start_codon:yes stop_codon:yes gene_type:complete
VSGKKLSKKVGFGGKGALLGESNDDKDDGIFNKL